MPRIALAGALAMGALLVSPVSPVAACSSMAPLLSDVAISARVIVRAEIAAVRGRRSDPRYDLRVLDVLKGRAPEVIRGFEGSGEVRGGVCDEGWWGGDVGDPVFLFVGTTSDQGTLYHPRLLGGSWSEMNDGIATRSSTAAGITAEIRAIVPGERALIPDALYLADLVAGDRADPPSDLRDADSQARLLHHADGQLSVRTWRSGGRRVDRFVIRAGDLATPGAVLFTLPARNTDYEAWAVGPARVAFEPSASAQTVRRALELVDAGHAVVEVWTRRSDRPRLHGRIRPVPLPTVTFSPRRQVTVHRVLPSSTLAALEALAVVPMAGAGAAWLRDATASTDQKATSPLAQ